MVIVQRKPYSLLHQMQKNMGSAWHTADTIISVFLVKDAVREPILEK